MRRQSSGVQRKYAHRVGTLDEKNLQQRQSQSAGQVEAVASTYSIPHSSIQRAQNAPHTLSSQEVLHLQRTIGNSAVSRMVDLNPIRQNSASANTIQRALISNETKIAAINAHIGVLEAAKIILRLGHGVVMLPFTIIDLLSNFWRFRSGTSIFRPKTDGKKNRAKNVKYAFDNVLNGQSQLVGTLGGASPHAVLKGVSVVKLLKFGPWNLLPWIMRLINKWIERLEKKKKKLA